MYVSDQSNGYIYQRTLSQLPLMYPVQQVHLTLIYASGVIPNPYHLIMMEQNYLY